MSNAGRPPLTFETVSARQAELLLAEHHDDAYAVQDACDAPDVLENVRRRGEHAVSLYRGKAWQQYREIGPFLIEVDDSLKRQLLSCEQYQPWGFFALSRLGLEELRYHLRRFLTVISPDGDRLYFRFYDPRVLVNYLPTCNAAEALRFMGGMLQLLIPISATQFQSVTSVLPPGGRTKMAEYPVHIRSRQMDAIAQPLALDFRHRMVRRQQQLFPDRSARFSADELTEFVRQYTEDAVAHRIDAEPDVEAYLDLCANFDDLLLDRRPPWVSEILEHPSRTASGKIDMLRSRVVFSRR